MLGLFCKRFSIWNPNGRTVCDPLNGILQLRSANLANSFSTKRNKADEHALVVSYLINSCGLSPEIANSASQKVNFRTSEKPISVLNLLKDHGFTNTHISKLVRNLPQILGSKPEKTILPKLEFFYSMGVSNSDLVKILSSCPALFSRSLENQLIPCYNFLRNVIRMDEESIASGLKNFSWFFLQDLEKNIVPKIELLKHFGVPAPTFPAVFTRCPIVLLRSCEKFNQNVKEIVEMGFDPCTTKFVKALQSMAGMSELTWEHKKKLYKNIGWSEDDILVAFRRQPLCMAASDDKITNIMDLLVNRMGWKPAEIARCPDVLLYSLEKRTLPRCLVIEALVSKGLVKKDLCLSAVSNPTDEHFLSRFVIKYQEDIPELLSVFQRKMSLPDPASDSTQVLGC